MVDGKSFVAYENEENEQYYRYVPMHNASYNLNFIYCMSRWKLRTWKDTLGRFSSILQNRNYPSYFFPFFFGKKADLNKNLILYV